MTIPSENLMIFELDGEEIAFDKTAVPNPPPVSFADDLSQLFREWHSSNLLVVNGRGIPIKHWNSFYGKRAQIKSHVWDVIRARWNKWKVSPYLCDGYRHVSVHTVIGCSLLSKSANASLRTTPSGLPIVTLLENTYQQSILALVQDSRDVKGEVGGGGCSNTRPA
ncbi:hypothetical protein NUW54_g9313 [Trametes sanguinea]|uniref:Uncharacterized protein n=1 Tax=Trametes sanguinea TaxID=158606 RepID=A0ACC1P7W6_9APHY|nr:hypothetical protein NUW54_g9313 [Trametes sanguinea]